MRTPLRSKCAAVIALSILALGLAAHADDGDLDLTFWDDGKVVIPGFGAGSVDITFGGLATEATGEMAVGYYVQVDSIRAYWRTVTDSTWGTPCRIAVDPASPDLSTYVHALAFDTSGRLLVLVSADNDYLLAYDFPSCQLDTEFGTDGRVNFDAGSLSFVARRLTSTDDGKIVIAGVGHCEFPCLQRMRVVRLEPDGDYDPTFALDGIAYGRDDIQVEDVAVAVNGHVVVAVADIPSAYDFLLQDFAADGTFLGTTSVAFDLGGSNQDAASAVAATPDGRIVVGGTAAGDGVHAWSRAAMALLMWDAQGELVLDPSFSVDGKKTFLFSNRSYNSLNDVVVQGADRIVVAGTARTQALDEAMAVSRLSLDGSFDGQFYPPGGGSRLVDFDVAPPEHDDARRLGLQNGRIVLAGQVDIANNVSSIGLARLQNQWVFADGFDLPEFSGWFFGEP